MLGINDKSIRMLGILQKQPKQTITQLFIYLFLYILKFIEMYDIY